jgi:hypothetical protein
MLLVDCQAARMSCDPIQWPTKKQSVTVARRSKVKLMTLPLLISGNENEIRRDMNVECRLNPALHPRTLLSRNYGARTTWVELRWSG